MHESLVKALETQLFDKYVNKIKELGYNAIILGGRELDESLAEEALITTLASALTQKQIKCIIHFQNQQDWVKRSHLADIGLWMSQCAKQTPKGHKTLSDVLQEELKIVEGIVGKRIPLIFYLPMDPKLRGWRNARLFDDLCLAASTGTMLAFPSVAGCFWHEHLPIHPFIQQLRRQRELHSTPFLPVINTGSLNQGEGQWPGICYDIFEFQSLPELAHQCAGFISMINRLPEKGEILECNLWVTGQLSMQNCSTETLIEAWWKFNHHPLDYHKLKSFLKLIRLTIVELSQVRFLAEEASYSIEDKRTLKEYLLASYKMINLGTAKIAGTPLHTHIQHYITAATQILNRYIA